MNFLNTGPNRSELVARLLQEQQAKKPQIQSVGEGFARLGTDLVNALVQKKGLDKREAQEAGTKSDIAAALTGDPDALARLGGANPAIFSQLLGRQDQNAARAENNAFRDNSLALREEAIKQNNLFRNESLDLQREGMGIQRSQRLAAQAEKQAEKESKLSVKLFDNEKKLRDEFRSESKGFEQVQRNADLMKTYAGDATGASDVALVFSFFKTIDPNSTVREGEFSTAAQAAGLPAQLIQAFERLEDGTILPENLRTALVDVGQRNLGAFKQDQTAREERFGALATRNGLNPENVVQRLRRVEVKSDTEEPDAIEPKGEDLSKLTDDEIKKRLKI